MSVTPTQNGSVCSLVATKMGRLLGLKDTTGATTSGVESVRNLSITGLALYQLSYPAVASITTFFLSIRYISFYLFVFLSITTLFYFILRDAQP